MITLTVGRYLIRVLRAFTSPVGPRSTGRSFGTCTPIRLLTVGAIVIWLSESTKNFDQSTCARVSHDDRFPEVDFLPCNHCTYC